MFTDTHCHILKEDYDNIDIVIKDAKDAGIHKMINNGSNRQTLEEVLELSRKYDSLYGAIGIHPDSTEDFTKENLAFIEEHIHEVVAIGEIGLDYHYEGYDRETQLNLLEEQLKLAEKYSKPVIIHSRDATLDTINTLKKFPAVKGCIHCFTGSLETAKIYLKMGYKLGFGGVTTFKNAKLKEILKEIPLEAILFETDSPYLSPEPLRGTKNEPKNVLHIAKFISEVLGITLEDLSNITEQNVHDLFDI